MSVPTMTVLSQNRRWWKAKKMPTMMFFVKLPLILIFMSIIEFNLLSKDK